MNTLQNDNSTKLGLILLKTEKMVNKEDSVVF